MVKTKYRKINDGYVDYLQYQVTFMLFWVIPIRYWSYIFNPYYDKIWGRSLDPLGHDNYVCRYNTNLDAFVKQWPDIKEYFKFAKKQQAELEDKAGKWNKEIEEKKGKTEYFY